MAIAGGSGLGGPEKYLDEGMALRSAPALTESAPAGSDSF